VLVTDPARRTEDLGGAIGTQAFTDDLCREIARRLS
jgi:hypothetical protein